MNQSSQDFLLQRRALLLGAGSASVLGLGGFAPAWGAPAYQDFWYAPRELWIYRAETQERGRYEFWRDGKLQNDAWYQLLVLLRDVRAGVGMYLDPHVVSLIWAVQEWVYRDSGKRHIFRATDGARTEHTNATTPGAAAESEHLKGRAIDGHFEGFSLSRYAQAARFFGLGGVGLYSAHVHVDTGKVRKWGF